MADVFQQIDNESQISLGNIYNFRTDNTAYNSIYNTGNYFLNNESVNAKVGDYFIGAIKTGSNPDKWSGSTIFKQEADRVSQVLAFKHVLITVKSGQTTGTADVEWGDAYVFCARPNGGTAIGDASLSTDGKTATVTVGTAPSSDQVFLVGSISANEVA